MLSKLDVAYRKIGILKAENKVLMSKIEDLTILNKQLSEENAQLKKRLKIDSSNSNSNMPSSSNVFRRPTVSNRDKSDKSCGGQDGHEGNTLKFSSEPTDKVEHKPSSCKACGVVLSEFDLVDTRQVHDVEIKVKVTNHYIYRGVCSCCGIETVLESTKQIPHGVSFVSL